ncbi:hypothetical protein ABH310_17835, partial [Chromobacterium piscinae]
MRVVQQPAAAQSRRIGRQAMAFRVGGAADGRHLFVHQLAGDQAWEMAVGVVQRQIGAAAAEVGVAVAGADIELDPRMALGENGQAGCQPALGDGGVGM